MLDGIEIARAVHIDMRRDHRRIAGQRRVAGQSAACLVDDDQCQRAVGGFQSRVTEPLPPKDAQHVRLRERAVDVVPKNWIAQRRQT